MDLIVTDTNGIPTGSYASWTLDLAYGSCENDFDLRCPARLQPGCRWWVDGTGWGGIVDDVRTSVTGGEGELTYHGRDWHGLLASKILEPDKGRDYLTMSGTIGTLLRTVISRIGLQDIITVTEGTSKTARWQFDRYCDAWSGLLKMLRASGLRLRITAAQNGVTVDAPPITAAGDLIDSDLIDFAATLASHPVNHLICLGKGELKDRIVVHWYADHKGALSHTQTIKGADERTSVYELSNADAAELETKGKTKLQELRDTGSIDVDVTDGIDLDVGDTVTGRDNTTGLQVTAEITKKIVKISDGIPTVTYEATTASTETTGETGGGGSSSGDGHAYYAGSGLTLSNWTFSADVTAADLETVRKTATEANSRIRRLGRNRRRQRPRQTGRRKSRHGHHHGAERVGRGAGASLGHHCIGSRHSDPHRRDGFHHRRTGHIIGGRAHGRRRQEEARRHPVRREQVRAASGIHRHPRRRQTRWQDHHHRPGRHHHRAIQRDSGILPRRTPNRLALLVRRRRPQRPWRHMEGNPHHHRRTRLAKTRLKGTSWQKPRTSPNTHATAATTAHTSPTEIRARRATGTRSNTPPRTE